MAFDKRQAKAASTALREAVAQALRETDPIGLIQGGAPRDEYDPEVGTILPKLRTAASVDDVQRIVHAEFVKWFGEETAGSLESYERAAQSIWALIRDDYSRPSRPPDLEAEISLLPAEQGGRRTPAVSGYRPSHDFNVPGTLNDALHEYIEGSLRPGDTGRALLWLLAPEAQAGRLHPGFEFTVQEGARIVGKGKVLRVLNATLQQAV